MGRRRFQTVKSCSVSLPHETENIHWVTKQKPRDMNVRKKFVGKRKGREEKQVDEKW